MNGSQLYSAQVYVNFWARLYMYLNTNVFSVLFAKQPHDEMLTYLICFLA